MIKSKKSKFGFTLVELIVVIAIIAVLAAIVIPTSMHYVNKARKSQAIVALGDFKTQLINYSAFLAGKNETLNTDAFNNFNYKNSKVEGYTVKVIFDNKLSQGDSNFNVTLKLLKNNKAIKDATVKILQLATSPLSESDAIELNKKDYVLIPIKKES